MPENAAIWIAGLSFAAAVIAYAVKITLYVRDLDKGLRADMEARTNLRDQQLTDRDNAVRREVGETFHAQRTKIHEIETWTRDTFVRKDSFEIVVGRIEKSIEKMGDKIDGVGDKLEGKIDRLSEKIHPAE